MARRSTSKPEPRPANLTTQQMQEAIPRLERRLRELEAVKIDRLDEQKETELAWKIHEELAGADQTVGIV